MTVLLPESHLRTFIVVDFLMVWRLGSCESFTVKLGWEKEGVTTLQTRPNGSILLPLKVLYGICKVKASQNYLDTATESEETCLLYRSHA